MALIAPQEKPQRSLLHEAMRLGWAYLSAGADVWQRYVEINARYVRQAVSGSRLQRGQMQAPRDMLSVALQDSKHYALEVAMLPWLAAVRVSRELEDMEPLERGEGFTERLAREQEAFTFVGAEKSVTLPARVQNASQGLALYEVPMVIGQQQVDEAGQHFTVVNIGRGQTPLAVFIVDYRHSDLGTYQEFCLACLVTPKHRPWAVPGWYITMSPVNDHFASAAGHSLWGYPKTAEYAVDFNATQPDSMCCILSKRSSPVLTVCFPRGGSGSSTAIPWYTYAVRHHQPQRIIFMRTGRGERIRFGGQGVTLRLGNATDHQDDSLWKLVHELELLEKRPFLHSWTEYMSGEFGIPAPCGPDGVIPMATTLSS